MASMSTCGSCIVKDGKCVYPYGLPAGFRLCPKNGELSQLGSGIVLHGIVIVSKYNRHMYDTYYSSQMYKWITSLLTRSDEFRHLFSMAEVISISNVYTYLSFSSIRRLITW
jgi:hypothetical protein